MVRPTIFKQLKLTTISVPASDLSLAKELKLNISEICRNAIKEAIK